MYVQKHQAVPEPREYVTSSDSEESDEEWMPGSMPKEKPPEAKYKPGKLFVLL